MITKYESGSNNYYLHNAWSNSPDGLDNFSLEESDTAAYIGSYIDSVATENSRPDAYDWSPVEDEYIDGVETDELIAQDEAAEALEDEDPDTITDSMEVLEAAIDAAKSVADTAQTNLDAHKQYFYTDDNGAHVASNAKDYRLDLNNDGMKIVRESDENTLESFNVNGLAIKAENEAQENEIQPVAQIIGISPDSKGHVCGYTMKIDSDDDAGKYPDTFTADDFLENDSKKSDGSDGCPCINYIKIPFPIVPAYTYDASTELYTITDYKIYAYENDNWCVVPDASDTTQSLYYRIWYDTNSDAAGNDIYDNFYAYVYVTSAYDTSRTDGITAFVAEYEPYDKTVLKTSVGFGDTDITAFQLGGKTLISGKSLYMRTSQKGVPKATTSDLGVDVTTRPSLAVNELGVVSAGRAFLAPSYNGISLAALKCHANNFTRQNDRNGETGKIAFPLNTTYTNGSVTMTLSKGTSRGLTIAKHERVVHLYASFTTTSETAVGGNCIEGQFTTFPMPALGFSGCTYYGSSALILYCDPSNGTFKVRVTGAKLAKGAQFSVSCVYMAKYTTGLWVPKSVTTSTASVASVSNDAIMTASLDDGFDLAEAATATEEDEIIIPEEFEEVEASNEVTTVEFTNPNIAAKRRIPFEQWFKG